MKFLTEKKYFWVRFFFVSGIFICLIDSHFRIKNIGFELGWNSILFFIAIFLMGAMFQILILYLSDIFCEEKTFDLIHKNTEQQYSINDLRKLIKILYENREISKDLYTVIYYFIGLEPFYGELDQSQGDNFPPFNALTEENKIKRTKFLNELKDFIENLKNDERG